jgi:hypothetical protein
MILIPTSCNLFFGSPSPKNSKVKRAWPGAMGDRPGSFSRVRTSEDKVRKNDLCWSLRAVYVLEKRPDVSGLDLEEMGRYTRDPDGGSGVSARSCSDIGSPPMPIDPAAMELPARGCLSLRLCCNCMF